MYDITLCYGQDCPLKYDCYRFTVVAYGRQNYFGRSPFDGQDCEHLMDNTPQIQQIAYYIWLAENKPEGKEKQHWQAAKESLKTLKSNKA